MFVIDILNLKPRDRVKRLGIEQTVRQVSVVPLFRDSTDDKGKPTVIDFSYLELLCTGPDGPIALYAGPPVRLSLDILEFEV